MAPIRSEVRPCAFVRTVAVLLLLGLLAGCGKSGSNKVATPGTTDGSSASDAASMAAKLDAIDTSIPMVKYEWDPKLGDPSVPAELGGPGFTGEGWQTKLDFLAIGSKDAVKGGSMSRAITDWPATLRMNGKNWNSNYNYIVRDLCYPFLIQQHPVTLEYIPGLATHWWVSEDRMTYRFRLNPKARWSDGSEVTAEDYVESHRLWMDPTILFPSSQVVFGKFEPSAKSKYIIEIKCLEANWRNLLYAGSLQVLPAKEIRGMTGSEYLDKYQFRYTSFCGPYKVEESDIVMNQSLTLTRNPDWWDADNPAWTGVFNIDKLRFEVVKENTLTYEKAKRGELDYYVITTAKWFANDLPQEDVIQRGLVVRYKVFNDAPVGTSGIAMNSSRPILSDVRIRKALAHLFDRETLLEKLFYGEYEALTSYWQGATYGNEKNVRVVYDEVAADELLNDLGYTERDADGWRTKDGRVLELDLMYRSKGTEKILTIFQESTKRLGIKVNLKLLTPSTFWKNLQGKDYDLAMMNWGALVVPNPETSWKGELAAKKENNNVTAFSDPRVDQLLVDYDREYDILKRRQIIKEIDGIIHQAHPYALGWYKPAQRAIFANKFSFPKWGGSRVHEDSQELIYTWWVDPAKEKALEQAKKDPSMKLPVPEVENRFWQAWNRSQQSAAGS